MEDKIMNLYIGLAQPDNFFPIFIHSSNIKE